MRTKLITFFSVLLFMFAACQNEDLLGPLDHYTDEVTISSTILPFTDSETRASFDHEGDGKGSFASGDQIALYITPEGQSTIRRTATYNGSQWVIDGEKLFWSALGASKALFAAYYPAIDTPVGQSYTLKCETNQEFVGMLERSDKVFSCTTNATIGQPVNLKFRHAMHFLEVNLARGNENVDLNQLKTSQIYVNAYAQVQIDPATGKFKGGVGPIKQIRMRNQSTTRFRAILCPQPILEEWRNSGWLKLTINGNNHSYKAPLTHLNGVAFNSIESGKRLKIDITVGKSDVVIEDLTERTIWVEGLKNIPNMTTWGIAYSNMGTIGLQYQPYYGWYDIKKLDATGPTYGDHRLCWAATCSNMIHWWYDRNKDNVEAYLKYKKDTDPTYVAPDFSYDNTTHKDSGIFNFFKDTSSDKGSWPVRGLKWFLCGERIIGGPDDSSTLENATSKQHIAQGGFFGDVYAGGDPSEIWQGRSGGWQASQFIKDALNRGDVLGIDHQSFQGAHAITLWGATFDESGEVTHIYVCDNNHSDAELNQGGQGIMVPGRESPFGIFQMRIKRQSPDNERYFLESSTKGSYTINIHGFESMSQGKTAWERFWKKHPDYAPKK